MIAIVVLNGEINGEDFDIIKSLKLNNEENIILCADGGANALINEGIIPNVLYGDMDSINLKVLNEIKSHSCIIQEFNKEKDQTDGELIIDKALSYNPNTVIVLGGLGKRLDHTLGNLQLLYRVIKKGVPCKFIGKNETVYMSCDVLNLQGRKGELISVIPYEDECVVSINNLKYEVKDYSLKKDTPIGISNEFVGDFGQIVVKKGCVIVIHTK